MSAFVISIKHSSIPSADSWFFSQFLGFHVKSFWCSFLAFLFDILYLFAIISRLIVNKTYNFENIYQDGSNKIAYDYAFYFGIYNTPSVPYRSAHFSFFTGIKKNRSSWNSQKKIKKGLFGTFILKLALYFIFPFKKVQKAIIGS